MKENGCDFSLIEYEYNVKGHVMIDIAPEIFSEVPYFVLCRLTFNKYKDGKIVDILRCDLNDYNLLEINTKKSEWLSNDKIREFFELSNSPNGGYLNQQLPILLDNQVPKTFAPPKEQEKHVILDYISKHGSSDVKDPAKVYLHNVRELKDKKRSSYITQKTKLLRPNIYNYFKYKENITFCYYREQEKERDDDTIIKRFEIDINNSNN